MEETAVSANEQPEAAPRAAERRWPAIAALAMMVLRPATTARRTRHVSLLGAYGVHLLAAVLTLMVICTASVLADAPAPLTRTVVVEGVIDVLLDLADEIGHFPGWALLAFVGTILLPELIIAALALTIMPWGARDEPLRTSYRQSLRMLLLCTAAIPALGVMIAGTAVSLQRLSHFEATTPQPTPPPTPASATPGTPEWVQWQQERDAWEQAMRDYWRHSWQLRQSWIVKQPWYVQHPGIVIVNTVFPCIAWFLFLTLRAIGAARSTIAIARPPHCEACGYNLSTIPMESRCPECGEPVIASLGPGARPGTPWQRRRTIGGWIAWWQTNGEAIQRPQAFGRLPQLTTGATDHRVFAAWHLPILFAIGAMTMPILYYVIEEENIYVEPEAAFIVPTVIGSLCVFGAVGMTLLSAAVVGLLVSLSQKRNLLPGAIQVSSYLMTYLTAWCLFGACLGVAVALMDKKEWFDVVELKTGIESEVAATLIWVVPNVVIGVHYFTLVARGIAGTRYANR